MASDEIGTPIQRHPIGRGAILVCTSDQERVAPVVMVANRLIDVDTQRYQYGLVDGTNTNHWQYHEEDVESLFRLTGLAVTDSTKFVTNDDAKELLARRCDHHWTDVHDRDSHDVTGQQCLKCREIKPREALK